MFKRILKDKVVTIGIEEKPQFSVLDVPTPEANTSSPEEITQIATDAAVKVIGAVGVVAVGYKVISTVCDIAIIAAKAKL